MKEKNRQRRLRLVAADGNRGQVREALGKTEVLPTIIGVAKP